jgi:hypothetical protein
VAHAYNPNYLVGKDQKNQDSRPDLANTRKDPISTNKKLGVVAHTCSPGYMENMYLNRRYISSLWGISR